MKRINLFFIPVIFFTFTTSIFCQCDSIVLRNQTEVNQFISKYGPCSEVHHLIINDTNRDITQLDSLYTIERVHGDLRLNFSNSNENVKSIQGLRNLRWVQFLIGNSYKVTGEFSSLDTVIYLGFVGRLSEFNEEVFSFFPRLKHIGQRLAVGKLSELTTPMFTTGSPFELILNNSADSISLKVLSNRIKTENLKSLQVSPTYGMDLGYLTIIDSVEHLHLAYCQNGQFSNISTIKNLKSLILQNDLGNNDYGEGLKHVEELDYFSAQNNIYKIDYNKILPQLKSIKNHLWIATHDSLFNLSFLDNVDPPAEAREFTTVMIRDNLRLNDCNTPFLCEALARYPNSVNVQNPSFRCSLEEILEYCVRVGTEDTHKGVLTLSPNPTDGYVNIGHPSHPVSVTISDMRGQIVKTFDDVENEVNISDLPNGMYIFDIRTPVIHERHKIVKVE